MAEQMNFMAAVAQSLRSAKKNALGSSAKLQSLVSQSNLQIVTLIEIVATVQCAGRCGEKKRCAKALSRPATRVSGR
jgi:hypothetical protein